MLITVMCMYFFDLTLNIMTLAGLILGLGMIVDGAIVILENIYQYRERGAKLKTAAALGSHEMYMAIIASNLTTICVFIPIIIFRNDLEMSGADIHGPCFYNCHITSHFPYCRTYHCSGSLQPLYKNIYINPETCQNKIFWQKLILSCQKGRTCLKKAIRKFLQALLKTGHL